MLNNNLIVILTVKDVATLFCSSSVKPPTSNTRPSLHVSTHSTMSKSCKFFLLAPIMTKFLPHLWSYIYLYRRLIVVFLHLTWKKIQTLDTKLFPKIKCFGYLPTLFFSARNMKHTIFLFGLIITGPWE